MKKKALLALVLALISICLFAISVSATEQDPYASYYDKVYTSIDGTSLALYEKEGDTYYPLAWFYNQESGAYESFKVDVDVQFCPDGKTTPIGANTDFNQNADLIFTDTTKAYTMENLILINLHGSAINSFSGSWTNLPIEAIYCNTDFRYINGNTFNNNKTLSVFDLPREHSRSAATICGALQNCTRLKEIYIPRTVCVLSSAFQGSGLEKVEFASVYEPVGAIAWQTTTNKEAWFKDCKSLKTVILPKSSNHTYLGGSTFYGCSNLEELTIPSYITEIKKSAFQNCTALKKLNTENVDAVENAIILGNGITTIGDAAFRGVDSIKYIKLPSTLTSLGFEALRDNDSLQYIDYNDCGITAIGKFEFYDNKSLVTVSFPSGLTSLDADRVFNGCKSIEALYLPSGLTSICELKNMNNLYFTDEPIKLQWTDGMFESEDWNGQKPSKPSVYRLPSGITTFNELFNSCHALNDVIVFPEGVTSVSHRYTFYNLDGKTFAFLGNVTSFNQESNKKSNYYFLNDSVNEESLTVTGNSNRNLFFHSKGEHLCEKVESLDATCVSNKMVASICFCGNTYSSVEEEGTALGHNHTIFASLVYTSFLQEGDYNYKCERCEDVASKEKAPALFVCIGLSAYKNGNGITIGYTVNHTAIDEYTKVTNSTISFGVFVGSKDNLGKDDIFDENGNTDESIVAYEIKNAEFSAFEIKVVGFTDEHKSTYLALGAYVAIQKDGSTTYSYMQDTSPLDGEKYSFTSYDEVLNKQ